MPTATIFTPPFSRVRTTRIVRIESDRTALSNSTQLKQLNSSFDKRRHSLLTLLVATKRRAPFFCSVGIHPGSFKFILQNYYDKMLPPNRILRSALQFFFRKNNKEYIRGSLFQFITPFFKTTTAATAQNITKRSALFSEK